MCQALFWCGHIIGNHMPSTNDDQVHYPIKYICWTSTVEDKLLVLT